MLSESLGGDEGGVGVGLDEMQVFCLSFFFCEKGWVFFLNKWWDRSYFFKAKYLKGWLVSFFVFFNGEGVGVVGEKNRPFFFSIRGRENKCIFFLTFLKSGPVFIYLSIFLSRGRGCNFFKKLFFLVGEGEINFGYFFPKK